jgi:hypothetical protein
MKYQEDFAYLIYFSKDRSKLSIDGIEDRLLVFYFTFTVADYVIIIT